MAWLEIRTKWLRPDTPLHLRKLVADMARRRVYFVEIAPGVYMVGLEGAEHCVQFGREDAPVARALHQAVKLRRQAVDVTALYRPRNAKQSARTALYGPQHAIAGRIRRAADKLGATALGVVAAHYRVFTAEDAPGRVLLVYAPPPGTPQVITDPSDLAQNL
jgi:hypothetical protein